VAVAVLGGAVLALREATLSTHEPTPPGSTSTFVVHARDHRAEDGLADAAEALIRLCELEVGPGLELPVERLDEDRFRFVISPGLDDTDVVQFTGCLEDWRIDNLILSVDSRTDAGFD
jgi:hypothetical protein